LHSMNLRQLTYFVKVVETGNMTRAAAELFIAQPALGMQIRQLEESVGTTLFKRHSRGVEPNAAGLLLYERALAIFRLVDETRRDIGAMEADAPEAIRLGLTPSLMLKAGSEIAVNAAEQLPSVVLSMAEEMSHVLLQMLMRGELDVALAYDVADSPAITRAPLFQDDLVLVTLPLASAITPVSLADALDEQLVMPEKGDSVREAVCRAAADAGLEVNVRYQVRSIAAMKTLIRKGVAAGILPYATVAEEASTGRLQARAIRAPAVRRTLYLVWSRRQAFRNELALSAVIRQSLTGFAQALGPRLLPMDPPAPS